MSRPSAGLRRVRISNDRMGSRTDGTILVAVDASLADPTQPHIPRIRFGAAAVTNTGGWHALNSCVDNRKNYQHVIAEAEFLMAYTAINALHPEQHAIVITDNRLAALTLDRILRHNRNPPRWIKRNLAPLKARPHVQVMWQPRYHQLIQTCDTIARRLRVTRPGTDTTDLARSIDALVHGTVNPRGDHENVTGQ